MFQSLDISVMSDKVRLLSDKRGSAFVDDGEIQNLMEDSFELLFNMLVETNENYFLKSEDVTADANDQIYFPDDFYKIKLLERRSGTHSYPIYQKSIQEVSGIDSPYYDYAYT